MTAATIDGIRASPTVRGGYRVRVALRERLAALDAAVGARTKLDPSFTRTAGGRVVGAMRTAPATLEAWALVGRSPSPRRAATDERPLPRPPRPPSRRRGRAPLTLALGFVRRTREAP